MAAIDLVFSARVVDKDGVEGPVTFYVEGDDAQTLAASNTAWGAWAQSIDNLTDGIITAGKVTINTDLPTALKGTAGTALWEEGAVFNWRHAGSNKRAGFFIPALKAAAISGGKVLLTQTDVAALLTEVLAAVLGGNYAAASFQLLTSFSDVFLSTRKRRRQQRAFSYEI